jgi:hypothetical protein
LNAPDLGDNAPRDWLEICDDGQALERRFCEPRIDLRPYEPRYERRRGGRRVEAEAPGNLADDDASTALLVVVEQPVEYLPDRPGSGDTSSSASTTAILSESAGGSGGGSSAVSGGSSAGRSSIPQ